MKKLILIICLLLCVTMPVYGQQVGYKQGFARSAGESANSGLWRGLVAAWKPSLGNTGISTLRDISAFAHSGTLTSITGSDWVISGNPRMHGYALNFAHSPDEISFGTSASILGSVLTQKFTVSAWAKLDDLPAGNRDALLGASRGNGSEGWGIRYENSGGNPQNGYAFHVGQWNTETASMSASSFDPLVWNHIVGCFDGVNVNIYVNGILGDLVDTSPGNGDTAQTVRIGSDFQSGEHWDGKVSDVRIWNRVLSHSEILGLYTRPDAMFRLRQRVFKAPAAPPAGGIEILRRRIEGCSLYHDTGYIALNNNKLCIEKEGLALAFNN